MTNVIKYHNDINKLSFNGFTAADYNLFFAICQKVENQDVREIRLDYYDLKAIAGIDRNVTVNEFNEQLGIMNKRLMAMNYTLILPNAAEVDFTFFPTFIRDKEKQTLTVQINKYGAYLLNNLAKEFTAFEMQQFRSLPTKYSKTLFRLLKQFKSTGELYIKVEDFRERLDIPETMENRKIVEKVINPAISALQEYFPDLHCEVDRSRRQGRPVIGYRFIFQKEEFNHQYTLDDALEEKKQTRKTSGSGKIKNQFNNIEQHDYDFQSIEDAILQ